MPAPVRINPPLAHLAAAQFISRASAVSWAGSIPPLPRPWQPPHIPCRPRAPVARSQPDKRGAPLHEKTSRVVCRQLAMHERDMAVRDVAVFYADTADHVVKLAHLVPTGPGMCKGCRVAECPDGAHCDVAPTLTLPSLQLSSAVHCTRARCKCRRDFRWRGLEDAEKRDAVTRHQAAAAFYCAR